ncbi:phospholipase D beta 2-like [Mangifera indica]|uniref:phospholipase D beta 2-like n=1 Tax=Mangifera indica TaxID=29780 RepID=UPI001CFA25C0|nr:phospholipase D beta 2-like [Mangifera indica]
MENYPYDKNKPYPYSYDPPPHLNYGYPPPPDPDPYHQSPYKYPYNPPHAYQYPPPAYSQPPPPQFLHSASFSGPVDYSSNFHHLPPPHLQSHSGPLDNQYNAQSHPGPLPYSYGRLSPSNSQPALQYNSSFHGSSHYHYHQSTQYPPPETNPPLAAIDNSLPNFHDKNNNQDSISDWDKIPSYPSLYPTLDDHMSKMQISDSNHDNKNNNYPTVPASPPEPSVPPLPDSPLSHQRSTSSNHGSFYGYPNDSFSSNYERPFFHPHSESFDGSQQSPNSQIVPKGSLKVLLLHGNLDIWIYGAKNLPNMDIFSKTLGDMFGSQLSKKMTSDPYVTVSVTGAVVGRTFVISNSEEPVWQQNFYVPVAHHAAEVYFTVKDSDIVGSELIGVVAIPVEQVYSGAKVEGTYPILNNSGKPCKPGASLTLSIQYTPMERLSNHHQGVGAGPEYIGVPGTYFPLRKGGTVTLYQDAHVPDGCLPQLRLDRGIFYNHGKCWSDIAIAISQARRLIYITGWSVWHKVKLVRDAGPAFDSTLGELLRSKSQEGVRVLLLVWDDPTSTSILGYKTDGVMHTHDEETRRFFKHSSVHVLLCPRMAGKRHSWVKQKEVGTIYTHHQKTVIVDADAGNNRRKIIAFVGGLDLCDGRYDNPHHPLFRSLETLHKDDYHNPTFTGNTAGCAREPWHDLHSRIDGPAAYDVLTNFQERWLKASKPHGIKKLKMSYDDALLNLDRIPEILSAADSLSVNTNDPEGWHVQIFRSIDSNSVKGFPKDPKDATSRNLVCGKNVLIDMSIHTAYVKAIRSAQHFIYIENQYFIGSSYNWSSHKDLGANNLIPMEIALKIADKIRANKRFAAYIVLPMWPEGVPTGATTQRILFWQHKTMQMMYETIYKALVEVGLEGAHSPQDYLNFFCLGNREAMVGSEPTSTGSPSAVNAPETLSQKSRRFMIYVHSKGMIVDDEYVLLGSANINQRSMEGTRDTEIAMGAYQPQYTWARKLSNPYGQIYGYRMSLWAEHLGTVEECFTQPASLECVRRVRTMGEMNWKQFAADDITEMRGHLIKYPVEVDDKGKVKPIPGHETFPDVGGNITGSFFAIQENLTI